MDTRPKLERFSPEGFKLVRDLDRYVGSSIDPVLRDLICLRAALINGHADGVDRHSHDLEAAGMAVRKIFAVEQWQRSRLFTRVEQVALELTEEISRIGGGVSEDLWDRGRDVLDERELGDLIIAIGTIALWNRLGIDVVPGATSHHC